MYTYIYIYIERERDVLWVDIYGTELSVKGGGY